MRIVPALIAATAALTACGNSTDDNTRATAGTSTTIADASTDHVAFTFTGWGLDGGRLEITCGGPGFPIVANKLFDGVDRDTVCTRLSDPAVVDRLIATKVSCPTPADAQVTARATGRLQGRDIETTFQRADQCGINEWDRTMKGVLPQIGPDS